MHCISIYLTCVVIIRRIAIVNIYSRDVTKFAFAFDYTLTSNVFSTFDIQQML